MKIIESSFNMVFSNKHDIVLIISILPQILINLVKVTVGCLLVILSMPFSLVSSIEKRQKSKRKYLDFSKVNLIAWNYYKKEDRNYAIVYFKKGKPEDWEKDNIIRSLISEKNNREMYPELLRVLKNSMENMEATESITGKDFERYMFMISYMEYIQEQQDQSKNKTAVSANS